MTVSHLRFGKKPIQRPYLINQADFVACHNPSFLEKYDMLSAAAKGGTFLLTSFHGPDKVWDTLPQEVQKQIIDKKLKFYVIDAISLAQELGLGARINVIMQTAFFKISNIMPLDQAVKAIKDAISKTYGKQRREGHRDEQRGGGQGHRPRVSRSRCRARSRARSRCRRWCRRERRSSSRK